jgi:hypothetical protein
LLICICLDNIQELIEKTEGGAEGLNNRPTRVMGTNIREREFGGLDGFSNPSTSNNTKRQAKGTFSDFP